MKKLCITLSIGIGLLLLNTSLLADNNNNSLSSVAVVSDTLKGSSKCMHYKIIGMCFWLKCHGIYCHIDTTLKIDQYLPDAVVSSFTKPTNNPWWYAKHVEDPVFYQAGKMQIQAATHFHIGFGEEHDNSLNDQNNKFHEVDIIGNPTLLLFDNLKIFLPSTAVPFAPYYSSLLDAYAWRFPALERFYPGSVIPGIHDVGKILIHDWGPVYPRNGYVNQPDDAKAAAVTALRASTIITEMAEPHIYNSLSNSCGSHCKADPIKENSTKAQYQMIYPKVETQCTVFGGSDITSLHPWESDAAEKGHHRYIWVLWRHYHGCIPDHSAKYIGSINF